MVCGGTARCFENGAKFPLVRAPQTEGRAVALCRCYLDQLRAPPAKGSTTPYSRTWASWAVGPRRTLVASQRVQYTGCGYAGYWPSYLGSKHVGEYGHNSQWCTKRNNKSAEKALRQPMPSAMLMTCSRERISRVPAKNSPRPHLSLVGGLTQPRRAASRPPRAARSAPPRPGWRRGSWGTRAAPCPAAPRPG